MKRSDALRGQAGHEDPDVEDVVERLEAYFVVQKRVGGPADLARESDTRS
jgi:hypothetical protein